VLRGVEVAAGGRLTDLVSLGVLASSVPRDAVDEAIRVTGRGARRSDGKLPPHVMVYFTMALALLAEDDYEEVAARLTETLAAWGCWDGAWSVPTSGGITQARQRLGDEPLRALFGRVGQPVAGPLTRGAFLGQWRLMAVDGFEWDVPDTKANAAEFGYGGSGGVRSAFCEGAGGVDQRVRLACDGGRRDRPGLGCGQRRAVISRAPVGATVPGLAADR
jgi:hypothetical protein